MEEKYSRVVLSYNGDINNLESDVKAFLELSRVKNRLEELEEEGKVRDVTYGNSLKYRGDEVAVPVSFEAERSILNGKNLDQKGIPSSDRWKLDYPDRDLRGEHNIDFPDRGVEVGTDVGDVHERLEDIRS